MHDYFFFVKINYIRHDCYITAETVLSQKKKIIIRMLIQSVTKFILYHITLFCFRKFTKLSKCFLHIVFVKIT